MRLVLKQFQEEAVTRLVRHIRGAARDSRSGDLQSVCLSSTTGSGKTVMLTRAVELLLQGDDENAPLADATFLWITDQPELNEQTRKKMLATSSVLNTENLLVIDASFDQETISAGTVNFINIHKLGREKSLVTQGDRRTYTIWEIIRNTISSRPGQFFVVVDEAHRGMTEEKGQAEAATIIQKFIKGSPGELPPVPVVVGISATPERFNQLIVGTGRMNRPIDVDVADVRASGLIKDTIVLHHPTKEQPSDMTMLREAARSLKNTPRIGPRTAPRRNSSRSCPCWWFRWKTPEARGSSRKPILRRQSAYCATRPAPFRAKPLPMRSRKEYH
jgi:type III restriction enzyme